jgi:hypothetical protein
MFAVGIEKRESMGAAAASRYSIRCATVPAGTVHMERVAVDWRLGLRGAGNAGRGASPTAGKREGFSF